MTHEVEEKLEREKEQSEATRILSVFNKEQAIFFCEEMAKKLPCINDTPPIRRKERENYRQHYYSIKRLIEKL